MGIFQDTLQNKTKTGLFTPPAPKVSGYQKNVVEPLGNFSEGFAKGGLSTIKGIGQLGTTLANKVLPKSLEFPAEYGTGSGEFTKKLLSKENLAPKGTAQNIGYGAEKIAELFLPASKIAKAEKAADILFKGSGLAQVTKR